MLRTLALAGALAAMAVAAPALAHDHRPERPGKISVTGTGDVSVAPDMATLGIGVVTRAGTAAEAVAANNEAARELIDAIKAQGVAPEHIRTATFSVSPVYDHSDRQRPDGPEIVAYEATNRVIAEVHELDRLGALLDAAVKGGANRVDGLSFGLDNPDAAADEARARAVEDARHKAETMAEAAGVRLGRVLSISEGGSGQPVPMYARSNALASAEASVPIETGQTTIAASVNIEWEIEQRGR